MTNKEFDEMYFSFRGNFPEPDLIKIHSCLCGKSPQLVTENHRHGHNDYSEAAFVECDCGLKGKTFYISGEYHYLDSRFARKIITKNDAIIWWNNIMTK